MIEKGEVVDGELIVVPDGDPAKLRGPWGPVATVILSVLAVGLFFLVQIALAIPYLIVRLAGVSNPDLESVVAGLEHDGWFLALSELAGAPVAVAFLLLIVWLRKGPAVRNYFALQPVSRLTTMRWLLAITGLIVMLDTASVAAGFEVVPEWMTTVYRSAGSVPLLLVALLVVAPAFEELLFRGFLFEGMRHSFLGVPGTVVLASVAWACLHLQYEWFYVGQIFVLGILLGMARARTDSVVPPILMHILANGIAFLELILKSGG